MATWLVTGANRGIGLELVRQLAGRGETVIAVCRSSSDALNALGCRVIDGVDVATDDGVDRLVAELGEQPVDVLLNNAGILTRDSLADTDFDAMLRQFEVNAIGPLRVTRALLSNLSDGARVAIVTSRMGSITDNGSGGYYGYRASKAAVNIIGSSLARDLEGRGIAVALLHPGMVATDMTGGQGIEPEVAASGLIARIDELDLEQTGGFWHAEGYSLPW